MKVNIIEIYNNILEIFRIIGQTIRMPNPEVFIPLFGILVSFMLPLGLFLIQKNEGNKEATDWMHLVTRKLVNFKYIWLSILIFIGTEIILLRFGRNIYVCLVTTIIILVCFCALTIQLSLIIRWLVDDRAGIEPASYQNRIQKNILTKYTQWNDFRRNWIIFYKYLSVANSNSIFNKASSFYKLWETAYSNVEERGEDNDQFYFIQLLISSYDGIQLFPRKLNLSFLRFCLEKYSSQKNVDKIVWNDLVQRQISSVINKNDNFSQYEIGNIIDLLGESMNDKYNGGIRRNIASTFLGCLESMDDYVQIETKLPSTLKVTAKSLMDSETRNSSIILMETYFTRYQRENYKPKNDEIAGKIFPKADIIVLGRIYFTLDTINRVNLNSKSYISETLFNSMKNINGFGNSGPVEIINSQGDENKDKQLFIEKGQQREKESIKMMAIYYSRYKRNTLLLSYLNTLIKILSSSDFTVRSKSENIDGKRNYTYHLLVKLQKELKLKSTETN